MTTLIVYLRYDEIYEKTPDRAAVTDSYLASKLLEDVPVETHLIGADKKFMNGCTMLNLKNTHENVVLLGTIPYHLLIANLYHLEEQGRSVSLQPEYITTEKANPDYPEEFVKSTGG